LQTLIKYALFLKMMKRLSTLGLLVALGCASTTPHSNPSLLEKDVNTAFAAVSTYPHEMEGVLTILAGTQFQHQGTTIYAFAGTDGGQKVLQFVVGDTLYMDIGANGLDCINPGTCYSDAINIGGAYRKFANHPREEQLKLQRRYAELAHLTAAAVQSVK
jgi:hypothetical protein